MISWKNISIMGWGQLGDPDEVTEVILNVTRGEGVMRTADGKLRK